jgi:hypothetical protein
MNYLFIIDANAPFIYIYIYIYLWHLHSGSSFSEREVYMLLRETIGIPTISYYSNKGSHQEWIYSDWCPNY